MCWSLYKGLLSIINDSWPHYLCVVTEESSSLLHSPHHFPRQVCLAQCYAYIRVQVVHKRGLKHHHFISFHWIFYQVPGWGCSDLVVRPWCTLVRLSLESIAPYSCSFSHMFMVWNIMTCDQCKYCHGMSIRSWVESLPICQVHMSCSSMHHKGRINNTHILISLYNVSLYDIWWVLTWWL